MFRINTIGNLLLTKHFSSFLPTKRQELVSSSPSIPSIATMAFMAARVGSTTDNKLGGWYSYRASKAAVISLAKSLDIYLQMQSGGKAMSVALHPGTVKTGLSKEFWGSTPKEKLFEPEFAAEKLVEVVAGLEKGMGGKCWDWKGEEVKP